MFTILRQTVLGSVPRVLRCRSAVSTPSGDDGYFARGQYRDLGGDPLRLTLTYRQDGEKGRNDDYCKHERCGAARTLGGSV